MATTRQHESNLAIAEALNTLNSRIVKTETDFLGHLQKVEDRLDQIVDLTRTVAVLQQQSTQQVDQLNEMRTVQREAITKVDTSIARIHTRLDEIQNHQRDKMDLYAKEQDTKIADVKKTADSTDRELKAWLNRGWGAWAVAILIFGAVQWSFYRWVDTVDKEKVAYTQTIKELSSFKEKNELWTKQHEMESTELKERSKRTEGSLRDLEDLVTRRQARQ